MLIGSIWAQRITAIGFGRSRKEELSASGFQWGRIPGVWVLPVAVSDLPSRLQELGRRLHCQIEQVDARVLPPYPRSQAAPPAQEAPQVQAQAKTALLLSTPTPKPWKLKAEMADRYVVAANLPWPPTQQALAEAVRNHVMPGQPILLVLPRLNDLATAAVSRSQALDILLAAASLGIPTQCHPAPDFSPHLPALAALSEALEPLSPEHPLSEKSRGGRPAHARAQKEEVLAMHIWGRTNRAIARELGISPRSVGRILRTAELSEAAGPE